MKHLQTCLHPIRIYDKFNHEPRYVPCGTCEACRISHANEMVQRLDCESQCWQYTLFVTLTYNDEHLPKLTIGSHYLFDNSPLRVHPKLGTKVCNIKDECNSLGYSEIEREAIREYLISHADGLPYLSSVDAQRFIKRLRRNIDYKFNREKSQTNETTTPRIRYYIAGEYGPLHQRPHFHALIFFSSVWLASHIKEFIRDCWKFGFIDCSFAKHGASRYVASYCNCLSDCPLVYNLRSLRPFALYSKHPAIGSLVFSSETIRQLYLTGSLEQVILQRDTFITRPLWPTLQNSLYPRLSYFGQLSDTAALRLYTIYDKYATWAKFGELSFIGFKDYIERYYRPKYLVDYLYLLKHTDGDYEQKIQRFYWIVKRVDTQAASFGIDSYLYATKIIDYYKRLDYEKLKSQLKYEESLALDGHIRDSLFIDLDFAESLKNHVRDNWPLSLAELNFIQANNLNIDTLDSLSLEKTIDYKQYKLNTLTKFAKLNKTKRKNDYQNSLEDNIYLQLSQLDELAPQCAEFPKRISSTPF